MGILKPEILSFQNKNVNNIVDALYIIWQGWLDSSRTFLSVDENDILENGENGYADGKWEC
jgi:hypothetical protein